VQLLMGLLKPFKVTPPPLPSPLTGACPSWVSPCGVQLIVGLPKSFAPPPFLSTPSPLPTFSHWTFEKPLIGVHILS